MIIITNQECKLFFNHIVKNNLIDKYEANFFSVSEISKVYEIIKDYYKKYSDVPNYTIIKNAILEKEYNISESQLKMLLETTTYDELPNREWLLEKFNKYKLDKLVRDKLNDYIDKSREGKIEDIAVELGIDIDDSEVSGTFDYKNSTLKELQQYREALSTAPVSSILNHTQEVYDPNITYKNVKYLFYPLLKEGQLAILFGKTGDGKSIFAMEMALQIASGKAIWNDFKVETEPQKVLFIDFELGAASIQSRYKPCKFNNNLILLPIKVYDYNMMIGFGKKQEDRINRALEYIEATAKKYNSKVIFIDNLSNIADQVEQASEADRFISDLYGRMKALELTIVFLGHTPKIQENSKLSINQLKGSSSLTKSFESVIGFRRSDNNSNMSYIKQLKYRNLELEFEEDNVGTFIFDVDDCGWKLDYDGKKTEQSLINISESGRKLKYDKEIKRQVVEAKLIDGKSIDKIAEIFGIPKTTIWKFIKEYEDDKNGLKEYCDNFNPKNDPALE